MKKLIFISLTLLLLSLTSCGLPQNVKNQEKQALVIAQSIPDLPPVYSPITGDKMAFTNIRCKIVGYTTNSGDPIFDFSMLAYDSHFWKQAFHSSAEFTTYLSYLLPPSTQTNMDSGVSGLYGYSFMYPSYQMDFTLSELQQYQSELVWK